jgi:hypothetical protein
MSDEEGATSVRSLPGVAMGKERWTYAPSHDESSRGGSSRVISRCLIDSNVPHDLCDSDNHNTFFATAVHGLYILSRVRYPRSNDSAVGST